MYRVILFSILLFSSFVYANTPEEISKLIIKEYNDTHSRVAIVKHHNWKEIFKDYIKYTKEIEFNSPSELKQNSIREILKEEKELNVLSEESKKFISTEDFIKLKKSLLGEKKKIELYFNKVVYADDKKTAKALIKQVYKNESHTGYINFLSSNGQWYVDHKAKNKIENI